MLERLSESEDLKRLLSNRHLREYLTKLVKSSEPGQDMDAAMKEPIFLEFADECLKVVQGVD